jgi:4-alpha-glucanotransferase
LYDWVNNESEVLAFWRRRIKWCARLYDAVRIDHFRAFHNYWAIPSDADSAKQGQWLPGPGKKLLSTLHRAAPDLKLIAEDLGDLDEGAIRFVRTCGVPGMHVLVFAFDPAGDSTYLPHNCVENCVFYTGTHDTPTFVEWMQTADPDSTRFAREYLALRDEDGLGWGAVRAVWASTAQLAIAPFQDILGLSGDARMNTPGLCDGTNWVWRAQDGVFTDALAQKLGRMTKLYGR